MTPPHRAGRGGVVVDASVLTAVYVPKDVHHPPSRTWLRQYILGGGQLIGPTLLAVEVVASVARRTQPARGHAALRGLLNLSALRLVTVNRDLHLHAATLAADLRLKGADAVYVAVAERLGVPLISWDTEHRTRATQRIPVYTPETAPSPRSAR
jgi:predicted nucleic acid-binding protein